MGEKGGESVKFTGKCAWVLTSNERVIPVADNITSARSALEYYDIAVEWREGGWGEGSMAPGHTNHIS